ncbi:hypothetical protein [Streptomyces catenulae]|uniref:Hydrogenase expression protein HypF n=1 Tax=Streptomyces catenulae TaxID=66875 RepID=A0ABV2YV33_9ACTN|nr:hypothetical protein [Streptomyces catenulae]
MPGDELHENAAAGARSGPRHAAPKKPLLTRFHVPAGKAIAIAAMPSAVLMGMGFTPQLAMAKPAPKSPFKDGPCVTAPDQQEQAAQAKEKAAKKKAADEKAAKDKQAAEDAEAGKNAEAGEKEKAPGPGTPSSDASPSPSGSASGGKGGSAPSPSTTPSPSPTDDEGNPWYDPLGWGKKIEDAFHPGKDTGAESGEDAASPGPSATPEPSKTADPAKPSAPKTTAPAKDAGKPTAGTAQDPADRATDGKDDTTGPTAGATADPGAPDADGKKPFPCVVEKKSDGTDEQPPAAVPEDPWHLEATSLTLKDLDYKGVVNLRTPSGRTKQALKFTAGGIDIGDLHQIVDGPKGLKYHVRSTPGSTSTIRDGQVTLYTERLQGNLFGLIPIVFDPEHPPPINIPFAYFTKVKLAQAGQFGGTLHVPGLHETIENS